MTHCGEKFLRIFELTSQHVSGYGLLGKEMSNGFLHYYSEHYKRSCLFFFCIYIYSYALAPCTHEDFLWQETVKALVIVLC